MPSTRTMRTLLVGATLFTAPLAAAQVEKVNPEILQATSFPASLRNDLQAWVDKQIERLRSEDQTTIEEARKSLLSPFDARSEVSITFRLEYGRALVGDLRRLVVDDHVARAIAACFIAGKCGTPEMIGPLGDAIRDNRQAVRSAATSGLKEIIRQVNDGKLQADLGGEAVDLVIEAASSERDANVSGLQMIALAETRGGPLHARAASGLADAIPTMTENLLGGVQPSPDSVGRASSTIGRGLETIFRLLIDPAWAGRLDQAFYEKVCRSSGYALSFGLELIDRPEDGPAAFFDNQAGWRHRSMAAQAETNLRLAESRLLSLERPGTPRVPSAWDAAVRLGDSRPFGEVVGELLEVAADLSGSDASDFEIAGGGR